MDQVWTRISNRNLFTNHEEEEEDGDVRRAAASDSHLDADLLSVSSGNSRHAPFRRHTHHGHDILSGSKRWLMGAIGSSQSGGGDTTVSSIIRRESFTSLVEDGDSMTVSSRPSARIMLRERDETIARLEKARMSDVNIIEELHRKLDEVRVSYRTKLEKKEMEFEYFQRSNKAMQARIEKFNEDMQNQALMRDIAKLVMENQRETEKKVEEEAENMEDVEVEVDESAENEDLFGSSKPSLARMGSAVGGIMYSSTHGATINTTGVKDGSGVRRASTHKAEEALAAATIRRASTVKAEEALAAAAATSPTASSSSKPSGKTVSFEYFKVLQSKLVKALHRMDAMSKQMKLMTKQQEQMVKDMTADLNEAIEDKVKLEVEMLNKMDHLHQEKLSESQQLDAQLQVKQDHIDKLETAINDLKASILSDDLRRVDGTSLILDMKEQLDQRIVRDRKTVEEKYKQDLLEYEARYSVELDKLKLELELSKDDIRKILAGEDDDEDDNGEDAADGGSIEPIEEEGSSAEESAGEESSENGDEESAEGIGAKSSESKEQAGGLDAFLGKEEDSDDEEEEEEEEEDGDNEDQSSADGEEDDGDDAVDEKSLADIISKIATVTTNMELDVRRSISGKEAILKQYEEKKRLSLADLAKDEEADYARKRIAEEFEGEENANKPTLKAASFSPMHSPQKDGPPGPDGSRRLSC